MKPKAKKCKGTGKAIGYGCGTLQFERRYGLGLKCGCYTKWLLDSPEGQKKLSKTVISSRRRVEKDKRKEHREWKEKHKSIQKLIQEARIPFQKWIRMRDANFKCISCGSSSEMRDSSHYFKAENYSGMMFDEMNVHASCKYCNMYLDGNLSEYRKGLVKRYGETYVLKLESNAQEKRNKKYTRDELFEIKLKYQNKLKKLS